MRVLITGATGFIGWRAAKHLAEAGHQITATGRKIGKGISEHPNIEWKLGSLEDPQFANKLTRDIDLILHCAGKAGVWGSYSDFYNANVMATRNLVDAGRAAGVKRFVLLSSPSIYFEFHDQLDLKEEDLPRHFSNHYARTKYESEQLVLAAHSSQFQTVALRPRFVIGAGDNNILPRLIKLQRSGSFFQVGAGRNRVSVTSIENLLHAIDLCLEAPEAAMGEVYNIANLEPVDFWPMVDQVLTSVGITTDRKKIPRWLAMSAAQANEKFWKMMSAKEEPGLLPLSVAVLSQSMTLNIQKAQKRLGYFPKQITMDAIGEFANWWKGEHSNEI